MKTSRLILIIVGVALISVSYVYFATDIFTPRYELFMDELEYYDLCFNTAECSILDFERFMYDFYGIPTDAYEEHKVSRAKLRELVPKNTTCGFDIKIRMRMPPPYEQTDLSYDQYNLILWVIEYSRPDGKWHIYWWSPRR